MDATQLKAPCRQKERKQPLHKKKNYSIIIAIYYFETTKNHLQNIPLLNHSLCVDKVDNMDILII